MRVIAGSARRLKLVTPAGMHTRPTGDKIKETLFNVLQFDIPGSTFLDMFSGSGGIGIEALSRGAENAVFIDNDKEALKCINTNLAHTKLSDRAEVIPYDVFTAIRRLEASQRTFDIIFMDPPYGQETERQILERLKDSQLADADTQIVVEAALDTDFSYLEDLGFIIKKVKTYKSSEHLFIKRR